MYCSYCGKKQTVAKAPTRRRPHGAGTITRDKRNRKQWKAYAPSDRYGGHRKYLGAYTTKAEAQLVLKEYVESENPDMLNMTLEDVYVAWSNTHFRQASKKSIETYTTMWRYFKPIQDQPMREIKTAQIQQVIDSATSYSGASIIRSLATRLCNYAMENDIVVKNYAEFTHLPKKEKKEKRIFTHDEITLLWEHTDDLTVQIILFLIYTGLRIGELLGLKRENIHLDEDYIRAGEKTEAGRNRIIPLPSGIPEIKQFLVGWLDKADGDQIIPFTDPQLRASFHATLRRIGITDPGLSPHSTRHTFATLSAAAGIRQDSLQKIIGHADYSTTADVYIHADPDILKAEMSKLKK